MSEKKEKKISKKWIALILVVVLAIALLIVFNPFKSEETNTTNESKTTVETHNETVDKKACSIDEECEEIEMNAYDYIMEVMSAPQYWTYEQFQPFYDMTEQKEYCDPIIQEQNGSGWRLADEKTASFERGAQGVLTINFSNYTAESHTSVLDIYSKEQWDTMEGYNVNKFDFNNKEYFTYHTKYPDEKESFDPFDRMTREVWEDVNAKKHDKPFDPRWVIQDTMDYYESLFEEAGCPLLNMPEGTLESYKNKTVKFTKHTKKDNLIHRIWEQDNYRWDWENLDTYEELPRNQIEKIFEMPVPKSELTKVSVTYEEGKEPVVYDWYYYSPIFVVDVNKDNTSNFYRMDKFLFGNEGHYYGACCGAYALYYLKPVMEKIYGYNAVYLVNHDTGIQIDHEIFISPKGNDKEGIINMIINSEERHQQIYRIYPNGEYKFNGMPCFTNNPDMQGLQELTKYVNELADYYGVESPYADDYLLNFSIMYSADNQNILGLR